MEEQGIITKVTEPTEWVNSITYPVKPNGDLRICLDPKDLNKAIIREHYKAPTLEEITHKLCGATKFSKVDCYKGFFAYLMDKASSMKTTFNTIPRRGRYRYLRPWSCKCERFTSNRQWSYDQGVCKHYDQFDTAFFHTWSY